MDPYSTRQKRNLSTVTQGILAMAEVGEMGDVSQLPEKDLSQISSVLNKTLKQSVDNDLECDPDKNFTKVFLKMSTISHPESIKAFKSICDMVNKSTDYTQKITVNLEKYGMDVGWLESYSKQLRIFCGELKNYGKNNPFTTEDIQKNLNNIKLAFGYVEKEYTKLSDVFQDRGKLDVPKTSTTKIVFISVASFVKWLWKYKYFLWITGMLVYNVYNYVYLPEAVNSALALLTRISASVCYTFASDVVTLNSLVHTIINVFAVLTVGVIKITIPIETVTKYVGPTVKASATGLAAILMFFTTNFMSSLIRVICITIVNLGALIDTGSITANAVWAEIIELGLRLKEKGVQAALFVIELFRASGDILTKFVLGIINIGGGIIKPVLTTATDTLSKIYGLFSSGTGVTSTGVVAVQTTSHILSEGNPLALYDAIKNGQQISLTSSSNAIVELDSAKIQEIFSLILSESNTPEEAGRYLGTLIKEFPHTIEMVTEQGFNTVIEYVQKEGETTVKNIGESIFVSLENSMKNQGTIDVYHQIKKFEITGKESIITVLFILTMLTLFSSIIGY